MNTILEKRIENAEISFQVDDVQIPEKRFGSVPVRENLGKLCKERQTGNFLSLSGPMITKGDKYNITQISCDVEVLIENKNAHSLLFSVHKAFAEHLPLTLSPDAIWITILQGVAQHVLNFSEELRSQFVNFQDKKTISIFNADFNIGGQNDWENIINQFNNSLKENVAPAYLEVFNQHFSTTGPIESTVAKITCMAALSPYFDYQIWCGCGFPKITLTGEVADWRKLKAKIIEIEELFYLSEDNNLNWWTSKLKEVADGFIQAASGAPDLEWFRNMYKLVNLYLTEKFNGWIGWLFPYVKENHNSFDYTKRNPVLDNEVKSLTIDKRNSFFYDGDKKIQGTLEEVEFKREQSLWMLYPSNKGLIYLNDVPVGLSAVDLKIIDQNNNQTAAKLFGGFLGVKQNEDFGLEPVIGYAFAV